MKKSLDKLIATNWHPEGKQADDGYVITVPALDDFAVHAGSSDEAWGDYLEALHSDLAGYSGVNKVVPTPFKNGTGITAG